MLKIGITGGIGSGKSLVCTIFNKLGIPVFNADLVARQIMNTNRLVKAQLMNLLGNEIYLSNSTIHRKKLANIIFNDKFVLRKVNEIVHPVVRQEFIEWAEKQTSPYVIQEAAIIFENNQTHLFDKIITVTAPLDLKIERVIKRDSLTKEQVIERMENQLPDEEKIKRSDFVIYNDERKILIEQILEIHKMLI